LSSYLGYRMQKPLPYLLLCLLWFIVAVDYGRCIYNTVMSVLLGFICHCSPAMSATHRSSALLTVYSALSATRVHSRQSRVHCGHSGESQFRLSLERITYRIGPPQETGSARRVMQTEKSCRPRWPIINSLCNLCSFPLKLFNDDYRECNPGPFCQSRDFGIEFA